MNVLGIGPLEFLLIIILMLIFLGPEDLPVAARKLAQWWRELQRLSEEASTWIQEELEPELEEIKRLQEETAKAQEASRKAVESLHQPGKVLSEEVRRALAPEGNREKTLPGEGTPEPGSDSQASPDVTPQPSRRPLAPPEEPPKEEG